MADKCNCEELKGHLLKIGEALDNASYLMDSARANDAIGLLVDAGLSCPQCLHFTGGDRCPTCEGDR